MPDETVTFRIGGRDWTAPAAMPFLCLERAWPHIQVLATEVDFVGRTSASLEIVAAAMSLNTGDVPRASAHELKALLKPGEIAGLDAAMAVLLEASMPKRDAPPGEAQATSSTATSDPSLPGLSPEVSAAATLAA